MVLIYGSQPKKDKAALKPIWDLRFYGSHKKDEVALNPKMRFQMWCGAWGIRLVMAVESGFGRILSEGKPPRPLDLPTLYEMGL